jgi:hypothetical protein
MVEIADRLVVVQAENKTTFVHGHPSVRLG